MLEEGSDSISLKFSMKFNQVYGLENILLVIFMMFYKKNVLENLVLVPLKFRFHV